jgi:hypothetical protein
MIVQPFPAAPPAVLHAIQQLGHRRTRQPGETALVDDETLPRPWDPASCPPTLQREIWAWCEKTAVWINHEYAWRPGQLIPACWPQHPHIARELAALTCQRWVVGQATTPDPIEEWHRHTLPMFLDRLTNRLGEGRCRDGNHQEWPAQARYAAFIAESAIRDRHQHYTVNDAFR